MKPNPIVWFEIYVQDIARARKFAIGQYGFCALVVDTEGNCIGLHSMQ